jgi:hypothetical protein
LLTAPALAHAGGHVEIRGDTVVFTGTEGVDRVVFFPFALTGEFEVAPSGPDQSFGPTTVGRQPLTTPTGRSSATTVARPARSTTPTTASTSL